MADVLRRGTHQRLRRYPADFHCVVRDQPVAALDQLNCGLALADAAVSQQQDAFAVHLHEHPVTGDAGSELDVQIGNQRRHKAGGCIRGAQQRHLILFAAGLQLAQHLQPPGNHNRRRLLGDKFVDAGRPGFRRKILQIAVLAFAEDLDAVAVKIVEIPAQRQTGTVDVAAGHETCRRVHRHVYRFERCLLDNILQRYGKRFGQRYRPPVFRRAGGGTLIHKKYQYIVYRILAKL